MKFILNEPKKLGVKDKKDVTVSEAIHTIYKRDEEWMFTLDWNGVEFLFDGIMISNIYKDVIGLLIALNRNVPGFKISFLDSGCTAVWDMELNGEELNIDARWTTVTSNNDRALEKLREMEGLTVQKTDFMVPWKTLLSQVKKDLLKAGYTNRLEGFEYLENLN